MVEFQELDKRIIRIENAYDNFASLNKNIDKSKIDKTLSDEINVLMEQFKKIQGDASAAKQNLDIYKEQFDLGDIDLSTFSRKLSNITVKIANLTFDLDMEVSPGLLRLSKKLAEPVIEATKSIQEEHPDMRQEAKILETKMNEVSNESDVVVRIDKTLSLVEKVIELGKKIYPIAEGATRLLPLAGLFI